MTEQVIEASRVRARLNGFDLAGFLGPVIIGERPCQQRAGATAGQTAACASSVLPFALRPPGSLSSWLAGHPVEEGDVEGDVERGRQRHPRSEVVVRREALATPMPIADQPGPKTARQRKLRDQDRSVRRLDEWRFVPLDELGIVLQPGRERPPT